MSVWTKAAMTAVGGAALSAGTYLGLVTGTVPVDLGIGRRMRGLGPLSVLIDAPPEVVFDVIAEPYAERSSRAMKEKVRVLERGQDLVLAAHYTAIRGRLKATTVETVRFRAAGPHHLPARAWPGTSCHRGLHSRTTW